MLPIEKVNSKKKYANGGTNKSIARAEPITIKIILRYFIISIIYLANQLV